jgi:REP element-mobilizing transposase RayT
MGARKPQKAFDFRKRRKDGRIAKKPGPKPRKKGMRHVPHSARPEVDARHPLHVVLKVTDEVKGLRTAKTYQAIRRALQRCAARSDYRVVEISIQNTHVHLLAEAESKQALALGMQGFEISAAKQLNKQLGRKRGKVFASRYYAKTIKTPTQARNAYAYLFNNWRKHRADRGEPWRVDPWSSAWQFRGWATPHGHPPLREPLPVVEAQSWLLREGWLRANGGLIRLDEVPKSAP